MAESGSDDQAGTVLDFNRSAVSFDAGTTWTTVRTPVNNEWQSSAWAPELNMFASVSKTGILNRAMTLELES